MLDNTKIGEGELNIYFEERRKDFADFRFPDIDDKKELNMGYKIILKTWYQETPDKNHLEIFEDKTHESFEAAAKHLYENIDYIMDNFPIVEITLGYQQNKI